MNRTKLFLYKQRFGYGMGDFACNLIWQVISLYLLYFYTDVMELNPAAVAAMFVVCRVIDAITDVLVGFAIDKTKSRWGKSRPWFLFGAVPFAVSAFLAFSVPDITPDGKLIYAYATYIFLSFMYTVVNIPLASILPAMTDDVNERTVLATWRKFFAFLGSTIVSATALTLVQLVGKGDEALGFRLGRALARKMEKKAQLLSHGARMVGCSVVAGLCVTGVEMRAAITFEREGEMLFSLQNFLDTLMPGILPAMYTGTLFYLMKRKKWSMNRLVALTLSLGILFHLLGVLE